MSGAQVQSSITIRAGIQAVWQAITLSSLAHHWWGLMDQDLDQLAREVSVRTGSSSFYRLWVERVEAPRLLEFTSSYLGVLPVSTVTWRLAQGPDRAVRVHLLERLPAGQPAELRLAEQLWELRLAMLRHVVEGTPRPSLPADIVFGCPLANPGWRPLHPSNLIRWLPVSGPELPPHWFYVIDSEGARPFPITGWRTHYDDRLGIDLELQPGGPPTRADLSISVSDGAVLLSVRHTGWAELALDAEIRLELRSRFQATWQLAISQATQGITSP